MDKDRIISPEQIPLLHFTNVKIAEQDTIIRSYYNLKYYQNNIKIKFSAINFKRPKDVLYQYQMVGIDPQWVTSSLNIATYPSLPSGNFTFKVRTKTKNTEWSAVQTIRFKIGYPFWQHNWFYILSLVSLVAAMLTIFQIMLRNLKKQNAIQQQLRAYQLTALRARMNPHFLFNSLNSIQDFILDSNFRLANKYLSKFSKLMRNILNMSADNEVSLVRELETLELYLEIEAMRFEENFQYTFDIEKGLNIDRILVPTLLVQPYLENAIKHGLMHKKGLKKITIKCYSKADNLCIEILDNGIGRKQATTIQNNNKKLYTSVGMNVSEKRLQLFNALHSNPVNIKVIDLVDNQNKSIGTQVILYLKKTTK